MTSEKPKTGKPGLSVPRRVGVSLYIRETALEWQVMRGHKILSRHGSEAEADAAFHAIRNKEKPQ